MKGRKIFMPQIVLPLVPSTRGNRSQTRNLPSPCDPMNTRWILSGLLSVLSALLLSGCGARPAEEEKAPTEVAVQVGKVARVTLRARVDAYGTVEAEPAGGGKPAGAARLSAPAAGIVMAVPVREGERVEAGAVIVRLDDRATLAQLRLAEQQMERQNKLKETGSTSEKAVQEATQQLAAAQAQLALVQLVPKQAYWGCDVGSQEDARRFC